MKKTRLFSMLLAVMMVALLCAGCGGAGGGTLTVGTNAEFPPFEYYNDKNEVDGFDIALITALAEEIGMTIKVEDMEFGSIVAGIESGNIQCAIAALTVTDERSQKVNFTDGYYEASQNVLVLNDSDIKTAADLNGKRIGVQEGTTGDYVASGDPDFEYLLGTSIEDADVKQYKKGVDAVMDLKNGQLDAVIIDSNPAKVFSEQNKDAIKIVDGIQFEKETYAIAVAKSDTELLKKLNEALQKLKDSGKYAELQRQYIEQ